MLLIKFVKAENQQGCGSYLFNALSLGCMTLCLLCSQKLRVSAVHFFEAKAADLDKLIKAQRMVEKALRAKTVATESNENSFSGVKENEGIGNKGCHTKDRKITPLKRYIIWQNNRHLLALRIQSLGEKKTAGWPAYRLHSRLPARCKDRRHILSSEEPRRWALGNVNGHGGTNEEAKHSCKVVEMNFKF